MLDNMRINFSFSLLNKTFFAILIASAICSCGNNNASNRQTETDQPTETTSPNRDLENHPTAPVNAGPASMETLETNAQVYAWVDRLNIRNAPNTSGKIVASATEQEALEFTGEKSTGSETVVLRGVAYHEPWLKVKTADGTEGWVFGGAIKRRGEKKGNDPISDERFFYPHFGRFDLSAWKKNSSDNSSAGDAESYKSPYTRGGRLLIIDKTDMGEYGYNRTYTLKEKNGEILKIRSFSFEVDRQVYRLTETVNVYTSDPPKKYTRSQKLDKHFMQLNARPVMVNGAWSEGSADVISAATDSSSARTNDAFTIGPTPVNCSVIDVNGGCSTDFEAGNTTVFKSDSQNGCLTINGKTETVKWEDYPDKRSQLYNQSINKNWIILNEKGEDTIFGKKLEMGSKYEEHRQELIQTLLVMDAIPESIPYQSNGTVGMGYRAEIRDLCNEAITMAKAAKEKGEKGPPTEIRFFNNNYKVHFTVQTTSVDDGGGQYYKGTMKVLSTEGKILTNKSVTGYSGC